VYVFGQVPGKHFITPAIIEQACAEVDTVDCLLDKIESLIREHNKVHYLNVGRSTQ